MSIKIDHLQRMTPKKDYPDFKEKLLEHSKNAYKFNTFQDYITAAEHKLGRRLVTHEIQFLFDKASTSKGRQYRWDFSIGHPRGRYVYERPMHNIYTKVALQKLIPLELDNGDVIGDNNQNVFVQNEPKQRAPRLDRRKDRKPKISDPDANKDKYQENKDLYDTAMGSEDNRFIRNNSFLQKNNVDNLPNFDFHNTGGPSMGKVLNSSVGEVRDLLSVITDNPLIRIAVSRLVREGYSPKVAREILADAEEVGAISVKARRVFAEVKAEDIPERLVPMTKHESQEAGQGFEDGDMTHDGKPHDWQTEVGDKLESGEMSPNLDTKLATRLMAKIEKISAAVESIEKRINKKEATEQVVEQPAPTLADIEKDLDGLSASVEKLSAELDSADSKDVEANAKNYKPEVKDYEAYPADQGDRTLKVDTLNDHHYEKNSAKGGEKVMNIEMGDAATYASEAKAIQKHDKEVVDKVKAARDRRTTRKAEDCKDCK
jgi:O6-methylguanine-DNA--protein-cysteine methyltransferase